MHVSDEAKLFAVRERLLQAERTIYEANKILANIGGPSELTAVEGSADMYKHDNHKLIDDVTGLYPGQLPDQTMVCELESEGVAECVE